MDVQYILVTQREICPMRAYVERSVLAAQDV